MSAHARVVKGTEARALIGDLRESVEKVAGRSGQPVEARHGQHVALVELREGAAQLCAIARCVAVSLKIFSARAARSAFTRASTLWPTVETRAWP